MNGWISVKDRLPISGQRVIAIDMEDKDIYIDLLTFFIDGREYAEWSSYSCNTFDPTHWMPLPEAPK